MSIVKRLSIYTRRLSTAEVFFFLQTALTFTCFGKADGAGPALPNYYVVGKSGRLIFKFSLSFGSFGGGRGQPDDGRHGAQGRAAASSVSVSPDAARGRADGSPVAHGAGAEKIRRSAEPDTQTACEAASASS